MPAASPPIGCRPVRPREYGLHPQADWRSCRDAPSASFRECYRARPSSDRKAGASKAPRRLSSPKPRGRKGRDAVGIPRVGGGDSRFSRPLVHRVVGPVPGVGHRRSDRACPLPRVRRLNDPPKALRGDRNHRDQCDGDPGDDLHGTACPAAGDGPAGRIPCTSGTRSITATSSRPGAAGTSPGRWFGNPSCRGVVG